MDEIFEKGVSQLRKMPYFTLLQTKSKYTLVDTTLTVVAAAFELVSRFAPEFKKEFADWNDGRKFAIGVLPRGPYITFQKEGDRIVYLGKGRKTADVTFIFKNLDSAVLVFTAQMGAHQAVAECRILVDGNNAYAMELDRALAIVETYLFPGFVLKKIFKRPPKLSAKQLIIKGRIMAMLLPTVMKQLVL